MTGLVVKVENTPELGALGGHVRKPWGGRAEKRGGDVFRIRRRLEAEGVRRGFRTGRMVSYARAPRGGRICLTTTLSPAASPGLALGRCLGEASFPRLRRAFGAQSSRVRHALTRTDAGGVRILCFS